jgi:hypothetical protein
MLALARRTLGANSLILGCAFGDKRLILGGNLVLPGPIDRSGDEPAAQDSEVLIAARNGHSTAPFAPECQSFLDNLRASFGPRGSANDPTGKPVPPVFTAVAIQRGGLTALRDFLLPTHLLSGLMTHAIRHAT